MDDTIYKYRDCLAVYVHHFRCEGTCSRKSIRGGSVLFPVLVTVPLLTVQASWKIYRSVPLYYFVIFDMLQGNWPLR